LGAEQDWTSFVGRLEVLDPGAETGPVLRLPSDAVAALGGENRVVGEIGSEVVDTVIVRAPGIAGAFLRIDPAMAGRLGNGPVSVRLRPVKIEWARTILLCLIWAIILVGLAILKMWVRQL
jgi:hypothetical protein